MCCQFFLASAPRHFVSQHRRLRTSNDAGPSFNATISFEVNKTFQQTGIESGSMEHHQQTQGRAKHTSNAERPQPISFRSEAGSPESFHIDGTMP